MILYEWVCLLITKVLVTGTRVDQMLILLHDLFSLMCDSNTINKWLLNDCHLCRYTTNTAGLRCSLLPGAPLIICTINTRSKCYCWCGSAEVATALSMLSLSLRRVSGCSVSERGCSSVPQDSVLVFMTLHATPKVQVSFETLHYMFFKTALNYV